MINLYLRVLDIPLDSLVSVGYEERENIPQSLHICQVFESTKNMLDVLPEPVEISVEMPSSHIVGCINIHFVKKKDGGILKLKKVDFFFTNFKTFKNRDSFQVVLQHSSLHAAAQWCSFLQRVMRVDMGRPRNLLVFVNPFGGKGRAKMIWEEKISNIFKISGIKSKVYI